MTAVPRRVRRALLREGVRPGARVLGPAHDASTGGYDAVVVAGPPSPDRLVRASTALVEGGVLVIDAPRWTPLRVVAGFEDVRRGALVTTARRSPAPGRPSARRRARLALPQPWSRRLGALSTAPALVRRPGARRDLREEAVIEAAVAAAGEVVSGPAGYTERVVEVPWVMRELGERPGRMLDVGTANAPLVYHRAVLRVPWTTLDVVDLVPAALPGVRARVGDVRALPFADGTFDSVVCVSTLDHVGLDNERYGTTGSAAAERERGDLTGLRELARVTRAGGRLLVTVPAGDSSELGWVRQYDAGEFEDLATAAGLVVDRLDVYVHDPGAGWRRAPATALQGRRYAVGAAAASGVICASLSPSAGADGARTLAG